jgi:TRAP-type C4-dicarboxylate transport system substrate-binding protein
VQRIRMVTLFAIACLGVTLVSCAPTEPSNPVELTFASWVFISPEQQAFMDEVEEESDGTITFAPLDNWTEPDGVEKIGDEFSMVESIAAGEIDVGWTSTRSFPAVGIDGFRAIEAPFLIQNLAGAKAIVSGSIGQDALAAFAGTGVTGLAIYPGTMRYPLTAGHPLLEPADWVGKRILYYAPEEDSVQARTVRSLGAKPVSVGLHIIDDINDGVHDGGADSLGDIAAGGANVGGPFPTSNVVLWPTILFYVMNTERFDSMDESQRNVIQQAAQHAADAEIAVEADPSIAASICATTARFGTATPEQLASLRAAVQPVYDWLRADSAEAPTLAALQEIAAAHPDPDAVSVPEGCAWKP